MKERQRKGRARQTKKKMSEQTYFRKMTKKRKTEDSINPKVLKMRSVTDVVKFKEKALH